MTNASSNPPTTRRPAPARPLAGLIIAASFFLWCALAAVVLHRYPPASWENKVMGWIELLTPAVGFAVSALCLVRWKGSGVDPGSVLVDLGRTQGREAAWGTLFLLSSLGVVGLVLSRLPPPGHGGSGVIEALFWAWIVFVWAIQSLIDGSAQTRLTERGVQFGRQFLAWERIESWQWKDGVGKRLVLSLKKDGTVTVLWGRLKMSLSVPAGQETAVEQVLAEHCPASNTAPAREADGGQP